MHADRGALCQAGRHPVISVNLTGLWRMQVEARSARRGVIRSSLQPEETAGLTRSGDLSRMLPFEAHLLAAGWPRNSANGELMTHCKAAADK